MIDIMVWCFIWLGRICASIFVLGILFFAYVGVRATWEELGDNSYDERY